MLAESRHTQVFVLKRYLITTQFFSPEGETSLHLNSLFSDESAHLNSSGKNKPHNNKGQMRLRK
jgi:hypothetical protein